MRERLKELRAMLGLSQGDFAEKIGIKQGSLSDIERGKVGVSNNICNLTCRVFNVNRDWLEHGIGEIFSNQYDYRKDLSDLEKQILRKFSSLPPSDKASVEAIIDSLSKNINFKECVVGVDSY